MRQADSGRHCNHFAAQEGEFHPVLTLGDTIAHRRNAPRDLAYRIYRMQRFANDIRVILIGLVGGQHVVVRGNNGDIVTQHAFQRGFIVRLTGSKAVGEITARQLRAMDGIRLRLVNPCEVGGAGIARPFDNAICYP